MIEVEYKFILNMAAKLKKAGANPKECYLIYDDGTWYLMDKKDFLRNSNANS